MAFLSFLRKVKQQCSPSLSFSFGYQSFLEHGLDGAMHHRAIEPKPLGDLVLIQGSVMPQGREIETASRGATSLSFQAFANCEVGSGKMCEERIFENVIGNLGFGDHWRGRTHRKVTV